MKTSYYTYIIWDDSAMAAGFDGGLDKERRAALVRRPEERARARDRDNVVDLTAWRAANLDLVESLEPEYEDLEKPEEMVPAPRRRKSHQAMIAAELVSTLCVVVVAAVLVLRILTF